MSKLEQVYLRPEFSNDFLRQIAIQLYTSLAPELKRNFILLKFRFPQMKAALGQILTADAQLRQLNGEPFLTIFCQHINSLPDERPQSGSSEKDIYYFEIEEEICKFIVNFLIEQGPSRSTVLTNAIQGQFQLPFPIVMNFFKRGIGELLERTQYQLVARGKTKATIYSLETKTQETKVQLTDFLQHTSDTDGSNTESLSTDQMPSNLDTARLAIIFRQTEIVNYLESIGLPLLPRGVVRSLASEPSETLSPEQMLKTRQSAMKKYIEVLSDFRLFSSIVESLDKNDARLKFLEYLLEIYETGEDFLVQLATSTLQLQATSRVGKGENVVTSLEISSSLPSTPNTLSLPPSVIPTTIPVVENVSRSEAPTIAIEKPLRNQIVEQTPAPIIKAEKASKKSEFSDKQIAKLRGKMQEAVRIMNQQLNAQGITTANSEFTYTTSRQFSIVTRCSETDLRKLGFGYLFDRDGKATQTIDNTLAIAITTLSKVESELAKKIVKDSKKFNELLAHIRKYIQN